MCIGRDAVGRVSGRENVDRKRPLVKISVGIYCFITKRVQQVAAMTVLMYISEASLLREKKK